MPYGGGAGMVVGVDVVARALEEVYGVAAREVRQGDASYCGAGPEAAGLRGRCGCGSDLVICGRYGGMDERVWTELATEAVSLGDFVLSGGEIVAAALVDAAIRRLHGVLGNEESLIGESFSAEDVVGPPQYASRRLGRVVGSGRAPVRQPHARIHAWRKEEARLRAARRTF